MQQLLEKIDEYENQIEDYKSELDKVNKVRKIQTTYWYENMLRYLYWGII